MPSPLKRSSIGSVLVAFWKSAYSDRSGPLATAMHSAFSSATFLWLEAAVYQIMLFLRSPTIQHKSPISQGCVGYG